MNLFWCLKYERMWYNFRPICLKTSRILVIDAPAINVAKLRRTLPAGYRPNIYGCDLHSKAFIPHLLQS